MAWRKRFQSLPLAGLLIGVGLRLYRGVLFGTLLLRHDPRLLQVLRGRSPAIFAMWHQDFVFTVGYLSRFNPRRRTYPLASMSRDGGLAAAASAALGFRRAVRGSSARGGGQALLQLTRLLQREPQCSLVVVCDGPRPPARQLKPGVLHLAQSSGRPLWLVRTGFRGVRILRRTWARFHVPLPFKAGVCLADGPIQVPADLDREGLEALRRDVEARLNRLADRADRLAAGLGGPRPRGGDRPGPGSQPDLVSRQGRDTRSGSQSE